MNSVGTAPGTITMQLPDGRVVALADWIDDKIYATVQLEIGDVSALIAFSTGATQVIPGGSRPSTEVDTNSPRNGDSGLPKDYEFVCYGFSWELTRATRPDEGDTTIDGLDSYSDPVAVQTFFEIDRRIFFSYKYNNRTVAEGRMSDFPAGHGLSVFSTNSDIEIANNGIPSPRDRTALVLPVHHKENLTFKGILQPMVALTWGIPYGAGQPALDGGDALEFVDARLSCFGLIRRAVPA